MALKTKKQASEIAHSSTIENLDYNTQRTLLVVPEYGRAVQRMVDAALKIEDREKRNKAANTIVSVMGLVNPQVREMTDYKQKLWDHLHIMADFKLDVDSPFPAPEKTKIKARPNRIAYPTSDIRYKYYGKTMEDMIRKISELDDNSKKEQIVQNLANFMKMSYLTWNKDTVDDVTIFKHMDELSKGKVKLHESVRLNHTAEILALSKEKQRDNAIKNKSRNNNNKNNNKRRKK
ncbi:MAG: DUF4290 domain-containing protein [Bacteroidia bacterium]